mmetsp:Transcript_33719/g.73548  ORF Transcript_33719/g.73548 Transcript_33719/m.73548 type:complete len:103 (+) Transcript_33719:71-379(+)
MSASAPVVITGGSAIAPVTYVTYTGGSTSAPMMAAPAVYNIPHELFAKIASGVALTPQEMAQITGQAAPATGAITVATELTQAVSAKKKSMKVSKKKAKGCC